MRGTVTTGHGLSIGWPNGLRPLPSKVDNSINSVKSIILNSIQLIDLAGPADFAG